LFNQIDAMLQRIRRGRGSASDELEFKTGSGGIIEAEFLIQALQMRAGLWNPQTLGALETLAEENVMKRSDAEVLRKHYEHLRAIESVLRRWEHKSVSSVPNDKVEQEKLAVRMGAKSLDAFAENYRAARTGIRQIYAQYFG
jgi:glutamine synthetase adenylyltransferase